MSIKLVFLTNITILMNRKKRQKKGKKSSPLACRKLLSGLLHENQVKHQPERLLF